MVISRLGHLLADCVVVEHTATVLHGSLPGVDLIGRLSRHGHFEPCELGEVILRVLCEKSRAIHTRAIHTGDELLLVETELVRRCALCAL